MVIPENLEVDMELVNPYDFKVLAPQLVHKEPNDVGKMLSRGHWLGSIKYDGFYSRIVKEEGQAHLFSRNVSRKTKFYNDNIDKVPWLKSWVEEDWPDGTDVICEVYYPDLAKTSKDITSILGALPEKAIARQEGEYGHLHFWAHDMLKYNGEWLDKKPYEQRYSDLCVQFDIERKPIPEFQVAGCYDSVYIDLEKKAHELIYDGYEGMVIRNADQPFFAGQRKKNIMFKIKKSENDQDIDMVITGFEDPKMTYDGKELSTWRYYMKRTPDGSVKMPIGNHYKEYLANQDNIVPVTKPYYLGWIGSFLLGAYDDDGNLKTVGKVSSGLTDRIKEEASRLPDRYLGRVVTLGCMSKDNEAMSLRHPYMISFNPKPAEDCKLSDIFS